MDQVSSSVKVSYFAILLFLLILAVWYLSSSAAENLEGNQIYTAGATMRVLGQQFSSTDQGSNDIVYNDEIKNWNDYKGENFSMPFFKKNLKKNVKI